MNRYFVAAAAIAFVVGLVHSVLGEKLIFQRLRHGGDLVPTHGGNVLGERHVRILWATWHIVTVFGWGMGAVLLRLALAAAPEASTGSVVQAIALAALVGAALVLFGTRAKHPGWIGLLAIAVCAWLGNIQVQAAFLTPLSN
jgi:multidrug transporter EmrE-like cation transporter